MVKVNWLIWLCLVAAMVDFGREGDLGCRELVNVPYEEKES
jgi:hypothetical protein